MCRAASLCTRHRTVCYLIRRAGRLFPAVYFDAPLDEAPAIANQVDRVGGATLALMPPDLSTHRCAQPTIALEADHLQITQTRSSCLNQVGTR